MQLDSGGKANFASDLRGIRILKVFFCSDESLQLLDPQRSRFAFSFTFSHSILKEEKSFSNLIS
jgi:hypothetical protein